MDFNEIFLHTQPYTHRYPVLVDVLGGGVPPLVLPSCFSDAPGFVEFLRGRTAYSQTLDKAMESLLTSSCTAADAALHSVLLGAVLRHGAAPKETADLLLRFGLLLHLHFLAMPDVLYELARGAENSRMKSAVFYLIGAREEAEAALGELLGGETQAEVEETRLFYELARAEALTLNDATRQATSGQSPVERLAASLAAFHKASRGGLLVGMAQTPVPLAAPEIAWETKEFQAGLHSPLRWAFALLLHTMKAVANTNAIELASISSCAEAPLSVQFLLGVEALAGSPTHRTQILQLLRLGLGLSQGEDIGAWSTERDAESQGAQYVQYLYRVMLDLRSANTFFSRNFADTARAMLGLEPLELDLCALPLAPLVVEMLCPSLFPR